MPSVHLQVVAAVIRVRRSYSFHTPFTLVVLGPGACPTMSVLRTLHFQEERFSSIPARLHLSPYLSFQVDLEVCWPLLICSSKPLSMALNCGGSGVQAGMFVMSPGHPPRNAGTKTSWPVFGDWASSAESMVSPRRPVTQLAVADTWADEALSDTFTLLARRSVCK